jgi:hypothetical protein
MTMLKDGGITKRLSAAARQTILEDFTIDRMVDKTIKIMRR